MTIRDNSMFKTSTINRALRRARATSAERLYLSVRRMRGKAVLRPLRRGSAKSVEQQTIPEKPPQEAPKLEPPLPDDTTAQLAGETPLAPMLPPPEPQHGGTNGYIKTVALEKRFGASKVVDNFSLHVNKGEIYGLLGPNGAGKTTLIKLLCGLLVPASGEAYLFGKKVPDRSSAPLIGYMPQELALYNNMTVHENIIFYGKLFGLIKGQIEQRERELLRLIDLEAYRGTLVDRLSGGMQHRVSLACALLHVPQVLFLDEPTVGVDPELRVAFWDYFEQLRDSGVTIFITTHYMDEARRCNRIGFMHRGRLIAEGSPQELLELTGTDSLEDAFLEFSRTNEPEEVLSILT